MITFCGIKATGSKPSSDYGGSEELIGRYIGRWRKNWRAGPLSQPPGLGQRNWASSRIEDLIKDAGLTNMEFMLRFTLSHPGLSSTIVGTASPAHLAANIATAQRGPLPGDLCEEAEKRLQPAND